MGNVVVLELQNRMKVTLLLPDLLGLVSNSQDHELNLIETHDVARKMSPTCYKMRLKVRNRVVQSHEKRYERMGRQH